MVNIMKYKRSLIVQVSNQCPCYCPGCYNYFNKELVSTIDVVDFLKKYVKRYNISKITISGGDPLLRSDIEMLLTSLLKLNIVLNMDTVGDALLNKFSDNQIRILLTSVNLLGLPLDGINTETIQIFRQGSSFENCIKVLEKASRFNANICINTVVHSGNKKQILDMKKIIDEIPKIVKWQLFQYMPIGPRGYRNREKYFITASEFEEIREQVQCFKDKRELEIQCKSLSERKNNYIILGTDGKIWFPKQSSYLGWEKEDKNEERIIVGSIFEKEIFSKLDSI